jgi:hypothetical protein
MLAPSRNLKTVGSAEFICAKGLNLMQAAFYEWKFDGLSLVGRERSVKHSEVDNMPLNVGNNGTGRGS